MSTVPSTKRGPDGSHAFVAMKLVKGPTLDSADRIPAKKAEVLALHDAHDHGVLHRDVKPENIGIARNPLKAYVTDFGLANQQQGETSVSAFRVGIGTVPHMPPEQAQGRARDVDRCTDVYSPGASRHELATAWPVVDARNLCSALVQIVERGSRVALGIPRPLRHHPQGAPKSSGRPMRGRDERAFAFDSADKEVRRRLEEAKSRWRNEKPRLCEAAERARAEKETSLGKALSGFGTALQKSPKAWASDPKRRAPTGSLGRSGAHSDPESGGSHTSSYV